LNVSISIAADVGDVPWPQNEYGARATGGVGLADRAINELPTSPDRPDPNEPPRVAVAGQPAGPRLVHFFVADVQTGFGPFVSVFLTAQK